MADRQHQWAAGGGGGAGGRRHARAGDKRHIIDMLVTVDRAGGGVRRPAGLVATYPKVTPHPPRRGGKRVRLEPRSSKCARRDAGRPAAVAAAQQLWRVRPARLPGWRRCARTQHRFTPGSWRWRAGAAAAAASEGLRLWCTGAVLSRLERSRLESLVAALRITLPYGGVRVTALPCGGTLRITLSA